MISRIIGQFWWFDQANNSPFPSDDPDSNLHPVSTQRLLAVFFNRRPKRPLLGRGGREIERGAAPSASRRSRKFGNLISVCLCGKTRAPHSHRRDTKSVGVLARYGSSHSYLRVSSSEVYVAWPIQV